MMKKGRLKEYFRESSLGIPDRAGFARCVCGFVETGCPLGALFADAGGDTVDVAARNVTEGPPEASWLPLGDEAPVTGLRIPNFVISTTI